MQIGVDSQRSVENKRVFVLDGDDIVRTVLQFMLADDFETHELADPVAALDKGKEWPPHLVLLGEPYLSQAGLIDSLRGAWPGLKVLAVQESAGPVPVGADGGLIKPFKLEPVRAAVGGVLGV